MEVMKEFLRREMMIVEIDYENAESIALERAETMVRHGLYNRFHASHEERIERAKIGCLGEIGFEKILSDRKIAFETDREDFENRRADEFDFRVNGYKIDVKVAKTDLIPDADEWKYGYPSEQLNREKDYIVVGWVSETNQRIGMFGWMPFSQIGTYPNRKSNTYAGFHYKTMNREFPWGDLNQDFEELFSIICAGRQ